MDCLDRYRRKNASVRCARDSQPLINVPDSLFQCEWQRSTLQGDPLAKLAQFRTAQFLFELWLTGQDDLQKLLCGSFKVCQQPDFFQNVRGQILGLVDDQYGRLPGFITIEEPLVQTHQNLALLS